MKPSAGSVDVRFPIRQRMALLAVLLSGCGKVGDGAVVGGETHFLVTCEAECGAGLSCIEGACTRRCEPGFSSCTELSSDAQCVDAAPDPSAGLPYAGVCEVSCTNDAQCAALGDEFRCEAGACRAPPDVRRDELASLRQPLVRAVEPATCDAGLRWVGGDRPSAEMHPGSDCLSCHGEGSPMPFLAAGTVYARGYDGVYGPLPEPLEGCFGLEGMEVVLMDETNREHQSTYTNRAGNFYFEARDPRFEFPYRIKLRYQYDGEVSETQMATTPFYGGCARCHSDREVEALGGSNLRRTLADDAERISPAGMVVAPIGLFD